jgi:putative transposase
MQLIMEDEVRRLAGERYQRREEGQVYRWGSEKGFLVVDGQKARIERPRLRSDEGCEQALGSYELFRRGAPLDEAVWDKLMLGLSTRNYGKAVRQFAAAYGIEKSAVSEHFIRVSRSKLRQLLERPLDELRLCALYIDGVEYHSQHMIVALGVAEDGQKKILGQRQGASENAVVAGELLSDLEERGLDFAQPRLYILDGAQALHKAVRKHAGKAALIQRCQLHKRRNVVSYLPEQYQESIDRKLANAYGMASTTEAKRALEKLHRELQELNPSAARSLKEGLDETLTVHGLPLSPQLCRIFSTTNPIESAFSVVERICSRVKCWQRGDHLERWVGSSLWVAEKNFRRVKGYKDLPKLLGVLEQLQTAGSTLRSKAA